MIYTAARALGALVLAQRPPQYLRTVQVISRRRAPHACSAPPVGGGLLEASCKASAAARTRGRRSRVERCRWSEFTLRMTGGQGDEKTFKKDRRPPRGRRQDLERKALLGTGPRTTPPPPDPPLIPT